uniref:Uncharacterized protein n=1 Tax=Brassica oleracea TaxID=3712 RepID=A0A3P6FT83_BRAOL|nr:unnamed protein product [Brassica oleracea]
MGASLVLTRNENGYLHDHGGHLYNAACQKVDAQGDVILEASANTKVYRVLRQRMIA